jgi:hypothetical protein
MLYSNHQSVQLGVSCPQLFFLFFGGGELFYEAVSIYMIIICGVVDERWIERDFKGSGRELIKVLPWHLPGVGEEDH